MEDKKANAHWVKDSIVNYSNESPQNSLKQIHEKAWGEPLVGFSSGNDDLYKFFKRDIGDFYWEPKEIFNRTYPGVESAGDLTVISWVLPQTRETISTQKEESKYPAYRWILSRFYGQQFIMLITKYVQDLLIRAGFKAIAPALSPYWEMKHSEKYGFASTWSERHAAFVCGLGTFGLSGGLITPVGKAMRCGSVISNIPAQITNRLYTKHNEYCLFFQDGSCTSCAKRCPAGAIDEKGYHKVACREYQSKHTRKYIRATYRLESSCCGLCQTKVPCESGIPG